MAADGTTNVEVADRLTDADRQAVLSLVARAAEVDGIEPLSEHTLLHVRHHSAEHERMLLVRDPEDPSRITGFAHIDTYPSGPSGQASSGGLVVDPAARQRGIGSSLVEALIASSPDGRLDLWAHGDHPAAEELARSLGFARSRVLWQMRRSLVDPLPMPPLPEGVVVRTFQPGVDDDEWLALNSRAFASHPEQGLWATADLTLRIGEPWFDPAGFFVAQRGSRMVAFHWTKVHGAKDHAHQPIGEVYVVGVDPDEQGHGLGPAMTIIGLQHLRERGLSHAMLYVDEVNTTAIRVYEHLGFTRWHTDICFRR